VLGPLLFLVYINNITDSVPVGNLYLFADDTTLFVKGSDLDALEAESNAKANDLSDFFSFHFISYIFICNFIEKYNGVLESKYKIQGE